MYVYIYIYLYLYLYIYKINNIIKSNNDNTYN